MLIATYRVIKFAFQNFWRNIWLSLVTIVILTLTFCTISFLLIFNVVARQSINLIQDKIDISVYFKPELSEDVVTQSQFKLLSLPWTRNIKYISREQSLENFRVKHYDNPKLLNIIDSLEENPLGGMLIVTAKSVEGYGKIIDVLNSDEFKDKIQNTETDFNDYKKAIDRIILITDKVEKVGITASIIFALITILIIFYTIKIAIYTHKDEIVIMKLVGAGNFFVKAPFLIESVFYAIFACFFAILILYPILKFTNPHLEFFVGTEFSLLDYLKSNAFAIIGWQLLGAIILNLIASSAALGKYLRA
ncbi:MAG: permease-like cell division protein FtsX [bacterium]